jgi:hypothetical protein
MSELADYPLAKQFLQETGMTIDQAFIFLKNEERKEDHDNKRGIHT